MDLAPGHWLLSPDGELIYMGHTLADDDSFSDHADTVTNVIRPDDDKHAHLLHTDFTGDEGPLDYRLVASDLIMTPDGYIIMRIVPPPGVFTKQGRRPAASRCEATGWSKIQRWEMSRRNGAGWYGRALVAVGTIFGHFRWFRRQTTHENPF